MAEAAEKRTKDQDKAIHPELDQQAGSSCVRKSQSVQRMVILSDYLCVRINRICLWMNQEWP